ncbi:MAG: retron system putative HNH endonuclease [Myxococcota bacterium]
MWTSRWVERRAANPGARFTWPAQVNRRLLPTLMAMTSEHCAYCDGWPLDVTGEPTIDHFRPKSEHPDHAYRWANLFPACERCQRAKGSRWEIQLLKPDEPDYTFDRYFRYVYATGRIEPNPQASPEDQQRAARTVALFDLNGGGRPQARRRSTRDYPDYDQRPFRFTG